jgi:hypothetical protein
VRDLRLVLRGQPPPLDVFDVRGGLWTLKFQNAVVHRVDVPVERAARQQLVVSDKPRAIRQMAREGFVGGEGSRLEIDAALHVLGDKSVLLRQAGQPLHDQPHSQIAPRCRFPALDLREHVACG